MAALLYVATTIITLTSSLIDQTAVRGKPQQPERVVMACSALYSEECCGFATNTAITPLDSRRTDLTVMFIRTTILRDAFAIRMAI